MNKVVALVSETGGDEPVLAVKMPRVARAAEALERESSSLRALETSGATSVLGVPRLLFEHRVRGQLKAIGQSAMHGDPAYSFLRKDHSWLKQRASLWLLELAGLEPSTARRRELGGEIIADLRSSVAEGAEQDLLTGAESIITGVDDLRLVFEQRDFSPWNVHVARDGSLVVYDWESAEPAGFPLLDLVYFLTHTAFFVAGAMKSQQFREAYRSGFVRNPSMSSCLHAHARALSIPHPYLPQLRTLTWIVHARSAAIRGDSPRTALFLDLLREEVATGEVSGVVP